MLRLFFFLLFSFESFTRAPRRRRIYRRRRAVHRAAPDLLISTPQSHEDEKKEKQ